MADAGPSNAAAVKEEPGEAVKVEDGLAPSTSGQATKQEPATDNATFELLLKEFFNDVREVDRDNEVNRILWAFKLNPFEKLNLRFDATPEDIRRAYRKISLLVHPDKCKHPQASTAFDIIGEAQKQLKDEEQYNKLMAVLNSAREEVRKERRKTTKHDNTIRLASALHEKGREGVEEEWEQTDDFHEKWKAKARDVLAKSAWRKKKIAGRIKDESERAKEAAKEAREAAKRERENDKQWESTREERVSTWRDFQKAGGAAKAAGLVKKLKAHDEDKLYVRRPATEEFRGATAKLPKKSREF